MDNMFVGLTLVRYPKIAYKKLTSFKKITLEAVCISNLNATRSSYSLHIERHLRKNIIYNASCLVLRSRNIARLASRAKRAKHR